VIHSERRRLTQSGRLRNKKPPIQSYDPDRPFFGDDELEEYLAIDATVAKRYGRNVSILMSGLQELYLLG
jgi:hypothetical protein